MQLQDDPPKIYQGLIIEPDSKRRKELFTALRHADRIGLTAFKAVECASCLKEAERFLEDKPELDIVLISSAIDEEKALEFVKATKANTAYQVGFVTLAACGAIDKADIGKKLLDGIDCILCEPFSCDNLQEVIMLAEKIRQQNGEMRMLLASNLMIEQAFKTIDATAKELSEGKKAGRFGSKLKKALGGFRQLSDSAQTKFFSSLVAAGEQRSKKEENAAKATTASGTSTNQSATPSQPAESPSGYGGASERVRRMHEARLAREKQQGK